jgi:aerobic-type carbon monoxide dehydrogenase small subunit (CoxS/CutS family)
MSPLQAAFVEKDALQCGFCTPGFVVSGTALLAKNPNPTLDEIKAGLAGNLCRCGTYGRIFEAVQQAARAKTPSRRS